MPQCMAPDADEPEPEPAAVRGSPVLPTRDREMNTCPDCGERVYSLGCTNCNEAAYIDEQELLTAAYGEPPDAAVLIARLREAMAADILLGPEPGREEPLPSSPPEAP